MALLLVLALSLLFLAQTRIAFGATITVNTSVDELNTNGNCSLREAIQTANGGGLSIGGSATLSTVNTIVANSPAGNDCSGSITSLGYNLSSDTSCGFPATGDISGQNPLLGPLQDNGGTTFTHELLTGSPAVNAGNDAAASAADPRGVTPLPGVRET